MFIDANGLQEHLSCQDAGDELGEAGKAMLVKCLFRKGQVSVLELFLFSVRLVEQSPDRQETT